MGRGDRCLKLVSIFSKTSESAARKEELTFTEPCASDLLVCATLVLFCGVLKQACAEYSLVIKRNKLLIHATTWMTLS